MFYNTLLNLDSFAMRIFGDFLFIQHMQTGLTFFVAFELEDIFLVHRELEPKYVVGYGVAGHRFVMCTHSLLKGKKLVMNRDGLSFL